MNHFCRLVCNCAPDTIQVAAKKPERTPSRAQGLAAAMALLLSAVTVTAQAIDVASQTDWNTAVAAVAAAGAGSTVNIDVTSGLTLTSSLAQLQASNPNVTVNITGNGKTIDGGSSFQGIQVSGVNAPTVNIASLAITNTVAHGGSGQNGQNGFFSSSLSYGSGGGGAEALVQAGVFSLVAAPM